MSRLLGRCVLPLLAVITTAMLIAACSGERREGEQNARGDSNCPANPPPVVEDGFLQPEFRHSENGVLETTLRAVSGPVTLDGRPYVTQAYESSVPGPMLVVCPGDRMIVNFENDLEEETNLHTHGFHVSPRDNSDNVFLDIKPGERFTYEFDIPEDHPPGAYWYHPHYHGKTEEQVFAGMAGPMIVEGGLDELPGIRDVPQRVLAIQNTELGDDGRVVPVAQSDDAKTQLFVNGAVNPEINIRPGELQRWRIYNMNADRFLKLRLEGQEFQLLATDGNTLEQMQPVDEMLVGPGSRREVLVRGGAPGSYKLEALPFTPLAGAGTPEGTVATLVSGDEPADEEQEDPAGPLEEREDLREVPVDREREIVYSKDDSTNPPRFLINGKEFDHDRVDQRMRLGDVEEWTITNTTSEDEWHTFHIHVNDFQLVEMDGKPVEDISPQDNVSVSPNSSVKMRTRFTDFTGRFVFHCHVLFHEDHGMMSVVEVVDPEAQDEPTTGASADPDHGGGETRATGSHHDEDH